MNPQLSLCLLRRASAVYQLKQRLTFPFFRWNESRFSLVVRTQKVHFPSIKLFPILVRLDPMEKLKKASKLPSNLEGIS